MPGPWPIAAGRGARDAALENARCEGCHAEIAAEWRASGHRRSHIEPAYARALAREPLPFCQGCHAPEGDDRAPVPEAIGALGTGCVTCHLTGEAILAAPRRDRDRDRDRESPRAPHPIVRDARFGGEAACASCHEFPFPDLGLRRPREPMQSTVSEHRASLHAAFSCAECHMPRVDGPGGIHRSHRFSASRDPEVLRRAAAVRAERRSPTAVRVILAAGEIGHAFPTGDLFRRLTISAEAGGARVERRLMRRFGEHRVGLAARRVQIGDDRVMDDGSERVIDLDLGLRAAGLPIRCRVDYERVEHPTSRDGEDALIEGTITVFEGEIGLIGLEGDR